MKKLFYKLITWFKGLFKKSSGEVEEVEEVEKVEKTKEEELFDKLKESGFFDKDNSPSKEQLNHDLAESARKRNEYVDAQLSDREPTPMSPELEGQVLGERAKDRTTLIRQRIKANEQSGSKSIPRTPSTNIGKSVPTDILKKMTGKDDAKTDDNES